MEIKICGIKNFEDAKLCLEAGANALGFLIGQTHASKDFLNVEVARDIISKLRDFNFFATLVTHLTNEDEIVEIARRGKFNSIQLHSDITDEKVEKIRKALPSVRLVRLIHVAENGKIISNLKDIELADLYLLDSFNLKTNQVGGTGKTHDWKTSAKLVEELNKPVVLAGGLTPENVVEAIKMVKPFGVDVNSGVKDNNGFKDSEKVKKFIANIKKVTL